jgi:hypothetical protein
MVLFWSGSTSARMRFITATQFAAPSCRTEPLRLIVVLFAEEIGFTLSS